MDKLESLLEELSNAPGPTGFEGPVRRIVWRELVPLTDCLETDGLGSVIGQLSSMTEGPRLMIAAHMDEVGLMVKFVTPEGYVRVQSLGGWLDQALVNQRWVIVTRQGLVPGVTGLKSVHIVSQEARSQVGRREQLFLDVGASSREDAEARLNIRPGDPVAPDSPFARISQGKIFLGKAWDDRVGLAVMIQVMRNLKTKLPPNNVYGVATVQEEVGLRGAHTSSFHVKPDVGINIEAGVAGDYPTASVEEAQEKVGHGPSVFLHDNSMIPNLKLRDFVATVAKEEGIPLQFNVLSGYGEDGAEMQRAGEGVPTINIAVPTRYLHTHNSLISREDVEKTIALVTAVIRRIDSTMVAYLKKFDETEE